MLRNIISILALALLIILSACGQKEPSTNPAPPQVSEPVSESAPASEPVPEPQPAEVEDQPETPAPSSPEPEITPEPEVPPVAEPAPLPEADTGPTKITVAVSRTQTDLAETAGAKLSVITFDDIDVTSEAPVSFKADRYAADHGVIITGQEGQYADDTFGWDEKLNAVSPIAVYAPGPISDKPDTGGNSTKITFVSEGKPAATSAFGVYLIDADLPKQGPSSITIYAKDGTALATKQITGGDTQQVFTGFAALDSTGQPVPGIYAVTIINGSGWPGVRESEVVFIDNIVLSRPESE